MVTYPDAFQHTLDVLGTRMQRQSRALARDWLEQLHADSGMDRSAVPSERLLDDVRQLIEEVARHVAADTPAVELSEQVLVRADELGELRHTQYATVRQLLREYQILGDLLGGFLEREITQLPSADGRAAVRAVRRTGECVRALQQRTVDTFVSKYMETIDRQTVQLRKFSRLVSHEIRQPLAVLQVLTRTLPVDLDDDAARMMDIFHRSVARLADVTGKLERLARITRATDLSPRAQQVDLTALAISVATQLADMAAAREVVVEVRPKLPVLRLDPARAELVFLNLIANAIKFSDPAKANRFVEIYSVAGEPPSVTIRDNGVGIPSAQLQNIFREFVRAHAQREEDVHPRGLGLGLSIVRECMDHANGAVRVESSEGRGTTFKLTWPSALSAAD